MALLLQDNDVFILNEPFNGVDLKGCILMKRLIRDLKAKEKTVIISSHLIASLREICDIIHYLNEGVIYKEYHEETTEEIEEDILCNTKSWFIYHDETNITVVLPLNCHEKIEWKPKEIFVHNALFL